MINQVSIVFCSMPSYDRLVAEVSYQNKLLFFLHKRADDVTLIEVFRSEDVQNAFSGDIEIETYLSVLTDAVSKYEERMKWAK